MFSFSHKHSIYILLAVVLVAGPCVSGQNGGGSVSDIVTDAFFNGIANQAGSGCPGRGFYTRTAFLQALGSYQGFGTRGSDADRRREIAAFFAHVAHETERMCYIEEKDAQNERYCDTGYPQWPCTEGRNYYGRGPLQLTWNYNYGEAGRNNDFDGLNNPDIVATDPVRSFGAALWYWMSTCHDAITSGQGFGATIRAINGRLECDGTDPNTVSSRVQYYTEYCRQLEVDTGDNLSC